MNHERGSHFDSIESAQGFLNLLSEVVNDTKQKIEADVQSESSARTPRHLEALRIASYEVEKLQLHLRKSVRILNDLRTLRRLLYGERASAAQKAKPVLVAAKTPPPVSPGAGQGSVAAA